MIYDLIVLDFGANDGCSIRKFIDIMKQKSVENYLIISYEALPFFSEMLHELQSDHVQIIMKAVSTANSTDKIYVSTMSDGSSLLSSKTSNGIHEDRYINVETVDIVDILSNLPDHRELWVKMDIEGKEYDIIERLNEHKLINKINVLYIEWHAHKLANFQMDRHHKCQAYIKDLDVKVWNALEYQNLSIEQKYVDFIGETSEKIKVLVYGVTKDVCKAHNLHIIMIAYGFKQLGYDVDLYVGAKPELLLEKYSSELRDIKIIETTEKTTDEILNKYYDIYYFRAFIVNDPKFVKYFKKSRSSVFVESHGFKTSDKIEKFVKNYQRMKNVKLVTINENIPLAKMFPRTLIHPCPFIVPESDQINKNYQPLQNGINLMYCGQLYEHKGIDFLIKTLCEYNNQKIRLHLVGGPAGDITRIKKYNLPDNQVVFYGQVNHNDIWGYLYGADYLILPNISHAQSTTTAPVKLMEYMYTGKPVIASDIEGITAWVNQTNVHFFKHNSSDDLVRVLNEITSKPVPTKKNNVNIELAKKYTVENKCRLMINSR